MPQFFIDDIDYPNDEFGQPQYPPPNYVDPHYQRMMNWHDLGPNGPILRGVAPQWVWMHPATNWKQWWLSGPREGTQGVVLAEGLEGTSDLDFEQLYSSGPYTIGSQRERTNYKMSKINFGVWVQPSANVRRPATGPFAVHKIEDSWRQSWSDKVPGFLGCFTRTHGWRFIPCIKGGPMKSELKKMPQAYGNNTLLINVEADAPWPLYAKRPLVKQWKATLDDVDAHGVATHTFAIPNRGTFDAPPKFIVKGVGDVTIQDGNEGRQVPIPRLYPEDGGFMLVDTDQMRQTITTEKQPIDSQLYKYMRNSQFLEALLHDKLQATLPAQRRIPGGVEFDNPIPPRTVAHITVTHSNPNGSITCIMPQFFRAAWS